MFKNYHPDRCYIIAEIGGNFTTFEDGKHLIDEALACGADAIKLQTFEAHTHVSKHAIFDMENTGVASQLEVLKSLEIDESMHRQLFDYAGQKGLDWFSTPSHELDIALLERCGVGAHKIGSDDAVNIPFLRSVARTGKPVILSTGMCTLEEVRASVDAILAEGNDKLILLHAITSYPTHPENVNLRAMQTLIEAFPQLDVGYSDHTVSPVAALCAVAMGARVIERHFTYDKNADGPDHRLSSDPAEMKWLVDSIRDFEVMRGNGIKRPAASEKTTRINNRKSIVMAKTAKAGERITPTHLAIKRPGYGIQPRYFDALIGRTLAQNIGEDDVLTWEHLA